MEKKPQTREITDKQGCWIKYKMAINRITLQDIATRAGCSVSMVSHVLRGRKNSPKVKNALIGALGCISLEDLIDMRLKECV